jgi:hypothetical protein
MRTGLLCVFLMMGLPGSALAQSYIGPAGSDVPSSGLAGLSKAERKRVCTLSADDKKMKGITRQQYRAACRGRPVPRG